MIVIARRPLTLRAVVLGAVCAAVACWLVSWAEVTISSIQLGICQFTPVAIGLMLVVVMLNLALGALKPRLALGPHEVIIIYTMTLVASLTMSRGLLERWIPTMIAINYYADPATGVEEMFFPHIPQWAVPFDVQGGPQQPIARAFYEGVRAGGDIPWRPWLTALAAWLPVVLALFLAYFCLASIIRRQWVDNEKLAFPLTVLPVELSQHIHWSRSIFADPIMWMGFAIPTFVFTLNGLHGLYPLLPRVPLEYPLNWTFFYALGRPWRDLGVATAYCSMAAVGFGYFLPGQVLFSLWAFFVLTRIQNIVFSAFGVAPQAMPMYPTTIWNGYQIAGAYLVLTAYLIRSARPHLRALWAAAVQGRERLADQDARPAIPPRWELIGLATALLVVITWFTVLGMSWWMATLQTVVFVLVVCVVMARAVTEAGLLMTETSFLPVDFVRMFRPLHTLGPNNLTALALVDGAFTRDLRGNLLSTMLDSLRMADRTLLDRRHLYAALAIALAVALGYGGWLHLTLPHKRGAITMGNWIYYGSPLAGFDAYSGALQGTGEYDPRLPVFFASGVAITLALSVLRMRYTWWPLSPLGFALSGSWSVIVFWFPIFIAWLVKGTIMRYGGMRTYQRLRPFFFGLILGEFSQAVIWALISSIWRIPAPFFPWP